MLCYINSNRQPLTWSRSDKWYDEEWHLDHQRRTDASALHSGQARQRNFEGLEYYGEGRFKTKVISP
jgi:hypothetical protein